ncbi:uncharacterized protein LOC101852983 [Aplysia californica]|uniref:Uncharacterized protein LOC101852983 n=1 Tax=Aplysia californica TaxID=6500 RepID=A0ABM1AEL4_APLCA|nr:uncharacterized protein LOC101852983 [Aplysia californica]
MKENDTFRSFEEFQSELYSFQMETFTQFTLRTSEKIPATDELSSTLKYSVLRYTCKQGRAILRPSSGKRSRKRSFKVDCPVQLNVRLNRPKGQDPVLKVTKLVIDHKDHAVSKEDLVVVNPDDATRTINTNLDTTLSPQDLPRMKQERISYQPPGNTFACLESVHLSPAEDNASPPNRCQEVDPTEENVSTRLPGCPMKRLLGQDQRKNGSSHPEPGVGSSPHCHVGSLSDKYPLSKRRKRENDWQERDGDEALLASYVPRLKKLSREIKGFVQLQMAQIFFNAENRHLPPLAIVALPLIKDRTDKGK